MNTSFTNLALNSVYLWLDNYLCKNAQAYFNTTTPFYYRSDQQLGSSYVTYNSPFKSFVWDSGVDGAVIMDRISGSFGTLARGQSGLMIDFINGRIIAPAAFGTNKVVSGTFAVKNFNLYFPNQTQENTVFTDKYYLNSRFGLNITGTPPPYAMVTPCIFISDADDISEPGYFGGSYNTKINITLTVFAENLSQLEGALSYITDAKNSYFPLLSMNLWPLNFYGDYKSGYNYSLLESQYGQTQNLFTITDVSASKVSDYAGVDESIFLGLVDLEIEKMRSIH